MTTFRLNEQHGSALYRRECRKCGPESLHNVRGCIHCGSAPKPLRADAGKVYRYGRTPGLLKAKRPLRRIVRPAKSSLTVPAGMRACTGCRQALPLAAFGASSRYPGGLQHQCKACVNAGERRRYAARKVRK